MLGVTVGILAVSLATICSAVSGRAGSAVGGRVPAVGEQAVVPITSRAAIKYPSRAMSASVAHPGGRVQLRSEPRPGVDDGADKQLSVQPATGAGAPLRGGSPGDVTCISSIPELAR